MLQIAPILTWLERKMMSRIQSRYGPNRVGPKGLIQPAADALKLLSKEHSDARDRGAVDDGHRAGDLGHDRGGHAGGHPVRPASTPGAATFGLYGIDVSIGLLYFFAFGAIAFYGFMLGGWASGSKYSFLGAMRSAAQLISYEVALGLSLLGVAMTAGSLSLVDIVE